MRNFDGTICGKGEKKHLPIGMMLINLDAVLKMRVINSSNSISYDA